MPCKKKNYLEIFYYKKCTTLKEQLLQKSDVRSNDSNELCEIFNKYINEAISFTFKPKVPKKTSFPSYAWFIDECKVLKKQLHEYPKQNYIYEPNCAEAYRKLEVEYKIIIQRNK